MCQVESKVFWLWEVSMGLLVLRLVGHQDFELRIEVVVEI